MVYSQEELRAIVVPLLRKYGADHAILFGSYARSEAHSDSDIDLLIVGGEEYDPTDVFCIADELHRKTGKSVDVYDLCEIEKGTALYHTIIAEGVKIA